MRPSWRILLFLSARPMSAALSRGYIRGQGGNHDFGPTVFRVSIPPVADHQRRLSRWSRFPGGFYPHTDGSHVQCLSVMMSYAAPLTRALIMKNSRRSWNSPSQGFGGPACLAIGQIIEGDETVSPRLKPILGVGAAYR